MISRTHIVLVVCCWLVAATGDIFDELDEYAVPPFNQGKQMEHHRG